MSWALKLKGVSSVWFQDPNIITLSEGAFHFGIKFGSHFIITKTTKVVVFAALRIEKPSAAATFKMNSCSKITADLMKIH